MKKFLAAILTIALAISLLAACGGGNAKPSDGGNSGASSGENHPAPSAEPAADSNWPEREVRLIVPYGEGGGSHKVSLAIKEVSEKLGVMKKPFIAVCMPNAATLEGQEEVLYGDPDGYTILMHHNAMINGYALGKQDFTYDSFRMIGQIYETPLAIAVRGDFPADDLNGLVEEIHNNPGKYKWTWAGSGGNTHFASYVFYNAAGISADEIVPCITRGDSDSVVQCVGGTADIVIAQGNALEEYVKSGDLKCLGSSAEDTITVGGTEVPSWKSAGYDGTYNLRFFGFLPKDTPDEVANAVADVFEKVVNSDEFAQSMAAQGIEPHWLPAGEAVAAFEAEAEKMNEIAKQMG